MSRRIEFTTSLTNADLLEKSLKRLDYKYSKKGASFHVTLGSRAFAEINTTTGKVSGDEDYINKRSLQKLYQMYSEEEVLAQVYLQGASIESREENQSGDVILLCRLHG